MFDRESFKRRLEESFQDSPASSQDEIRSLAKEILGEREYLSNMWLVEDIINWYSVGHTERKVTGQWYHTIEFDGGVTDGMFDHRPLIKYYGFPESFQGKKVLDVGCADGFFSFLFERRGADKVVALDAYKNDFFLRAKERLNSRVEYCVMDVYDLSPTKVGYFDFVFCGTLLIHLSDPFRALRNIRSVIQSGLFICATNIWKPRFRAFYSFFREKQLFASLIPGRHGSECVGVPGYWVPTEDCLIEMMRKSGFDSVARYSTFTLKGYHRLTHSKQIQPHIVVHATVKREDNRK